MSVKSSKIATLACVFVLAAGGHAHAQDMQFNTPPPEQEAGGQPPSGQQGDTMAPAGGGGQNNTMAPEQTVPLAQRGMVLPKGTLRLDTNFDIIANSGGLLGVPDIDFDPGPFPGPGPSPGGGGGGGDTFAAWNLAGGGFSPIDNLEVGGMLLPIVLAPSGGFGHMRFYGVYQLIDQEMFEVGVRSDMYLPTGSDFQTLTFSLSAGAPVIIHVTDTIRIDTGIELALNVIDAGNDNDVAFGVTSPGNALPALLAAPPKRHSLPTQSIAGLPFVINVNVLDEVFVGGRTGISFGDFTEFGDTVNVPLGVQAGYTLAMEGLPLMDFVFRFRWPAFVNSGTADTVNPDVVEFNFGAEVQLGVL